MAMGGKSQRAAEAAISACRSFTNSTGSLRGTRGSTRNLGWLSSHREARKIREVLSRATYVVWSYDTPIGCVTETDEDGPVKIYFDEHHTPTTSHHQTLLRVAFSDFETIGEGPWSGRRPRSVRRPRQAPTQQTFDRAAAARVVRENDVVHRPSTEQMLDPRYSNPDWTPWVQGGSSLPPGAEERDEARVRQTGGTWQS